MTAISAAITASSSIPTAAPDTGMVISAVCSGTSDSSTDDPNWAEMAFTLVQNTCGVTPTATAELSATIAAGVPDS